MGSGAAPHGRVLQRRRDRPASRRRAARVAHADQGDPVGSRVVVGRALPRRGLAEADRRDRPARARAPHDLDARRRAAQAAFKPGDARGRRRRALRRTKRGAHRRHRPSGTRAAAVRGPGPFGDVEWSPAGDWLLVNWPEANQWVFIKGKQVRAVANIRQQFARADGLGPMLELSGRWCCSK